MSNPESVKAEDLPNEQTEQEKDDEDQKRKMVEKGLLQSKQIRDNPLAKNLVIGKRGRPPTKQYSEAFSKFQKSEFDGKVPKTVEESCERIK